MQVQICVWAIGGSAINSAIPSTGIVVLSVRDVGSQIDYRIAGAGQQVDVALGSVFMTHYLPVPDGHMETLRRLHGCKVALKSSRRVSLGTGSTEISVTVHPYNNLPIEILKSHIDDAMGVLMPPFDVLGTAERSSEDEGRRAAIARLSGPSSPAVV